MNIDKLAFIGLIEVIQIKFRELQDAIRCGKEAQYVYNMITGDLTDLQNMKQDIMEGDNK